MPSLPLGFERDLKAYDKALRARFGANTGLWIIERKLDHRQPAWLMEKPSPWKSKRGLDAWEGWKDGYVIVLMVHPTLMAWSQVEAALREADLHVQGGKAGLIRKLDEAEEAWEKATDRLRDNYTEEAANEAFHMLKWREGNRMILDPEDREPVVRDAVTEHEGFTVVERRKVSVG